MHATSVFLSAGLTTASFADCTEMDLGDKAQIIMSSINSKIAASQFNMDQLDINQLDVDQFGISEFDGLEEQLQQASSFYEAGKLEEACQIYDKIIAEHHLSPKN